MNLLGTAVRHPKQASLAIKQAIKQSASFNWLYYIHPSKLSKQCASVGTYILINIVIIIGPNHNQLTVPTSSYSTGCTSSSSSLSLQLPLPLYCQLQTDFLWVPMMWWHDMTIDLIKSLNGALNDWMIDWMNEWTKERRNEMHSSFYPSLQIFTSVT